MQHMKISLLCFDLSHNCLGRTYILAKVLRRHFEVEIIGPMFGGKIWPPCDTGEFQYKFVHGSRYPNFVSGIKKLIDMISGDVIYANKLQPTSFGVGLLKKVASQKPLVLDIDDWEAGFCLGQKNEWLNPLGCGWTKFMEKLVGFADQITTVSSTLNEKYGSRGVFVPHGRDPNVLDPDKFSKVESKEKLGLLNNKVIMFLGSVRPHKGLEDLIEAVKSLANPQIQIVIIDSLEDNLFLSDLYKENPSLKILGYQPISKVAEILAAADLVVLAQKEDALANFQIPAKIFDAMSMAKPIIATKVSDLANILEGCGYLVETFSPKDLAERIKYVLDNVSESQELGQRARLKMINEYSFDKMEEVLLGVFSKYSKN